MSDVPEQSPDTDGPLNLFDTITATVVDAPAETMPQQPARKTASQKARELISGTKINSEAGEDRGRNRRTAKKTANTTRKTEPASKPGEFVEPMTEMYTWLGMGVSVLDMRTGHIIEDDQGLPHTPCAETILEAAPKIAQAWDELAQRNPAVRKALRGLTTTSVAGQLIMAHAPIALVMIQAHVIGQNNVHDHDVRVDHEAYTDANENRD